MLGVDILECRCYSRNICFPIYRRGQEGDPTICIQHGATGASQHLYGPSFRKHLAMFGNLWRPSDAVLLGPPRNLRARALRRARSPSKGNTVLYRWVRGFLHDGDDASYV